MATRAYIIRHEDIAPGATGTEFILSSLVCYVQDQGQGKVCAYVDTTYLWSDTDAQIAAKIGTAIQNKVAEFGFTVSALNSKIPAYIGV